MERERMTMEDIITSLYKRRWKEKDLEALEISVKQKIKEEEMERYQQRVRN